MADSAPIFAPDGTIRQIPADQLQAAMTDGGKLAVQMKAPDGSMRYVPHDQVGAAQKAGGVVNTEQGTPGSPQPKEGFWHSLGSVFGITPEAMKAGQEEYERRGGGLRAALSMSTEAASPHPIEIVKGAASAVKDNATKAYGEAAASNDAVERGDIVGFLAHQIGGMGYMGATLAAPLLGDSPAKAGEQIGDGNIKGGLGTTAGIIAPALIPEIARVAPEAVDAVNSVRGKAARAIVKPLVKKPLGAAMEDARFDRNPSQAITDEGLVGTKNRIVSQAQDRVAELSKATDATLQNHPNANVQIDAEPIIDSAIDNAVASAKKTGNKAMITRLENVREALKTEYGPTQGTPLEINNLKRDVGSVASDLGAFKATDPVEASVAGAMQDVYTGLKNAVNRQVPEVAPLNERVANLLSAQTALKRNMALDANSNLLDSHTIYSAGAKLAKKTIGSAPVRTATARALNIGNKLEVPQASPQPQPIIRGQLPAAPIITPQPANPSGSVPYNAPPVAATSRAQRMGLLQPGGLQGILKGQQAPSEAIPAAQPRSLQEIIKGQPERRQNLDLRSVVDSMTPEQKQAAIFTNNLSDMPNGRAFGVAQQQLAETHPHVGFADIDGFKDFNTQLGEPAVDKQVFPAIGEAMRNAIEKENGTVHGFHVHGDEFTFLGSDPQAIGRVVDGVNKQLENATFTVQKPDGTIVSKEGVGFSHGTGSTLEAANAAEKISKQARKEAGLRTGARDAPQNQTPQVPSRQQASLNQDAQRQSLRGAANADQKNTVTTRSLSDILNGRKPPKKGGK